MPSQLGTWELVIVLVVALLIFGVGRVSKIGRELGEGIRGFRQGLTGDEAGNEVTEEE